MICDSGRGLLYRNRNDGSFIGEIQSLYAFDPSLKAVLSEQQDSNLTEKGGLTITGAERWRMTATQKAKEMLDVREWRE